MPPDPPIHANLRNDFFFPKFVDLPKDTRASKRYFRRKSRRVMTPRKHWCFFAEVVQSQQVGRLVLNVSDKAGKIIHVAFYIPDNGQKLVTEIKPGQTLAIIYGRQHVFWDGSKGVKVESPDEFKVIPTSLNNLFHMSDCIQSGQFFNNKARCHGCGRENEALKKCGKCGYYWYCNKECQTIAWEEKGHKEDCKVLNDPDFQEMLTMDWADFKKFKGFPLKKA